MNTGTITRYDPHLHRTDLARALLALRVSGSAYPPAQDAASDRMSMAAWLDEGDGSGVSRFVYALGGVALGHILFGPAHEYLTGHLAGLVGEQEGMPVAEIGKLFVGPGAQGAGAGRQLLVHALAESRGAGWLPSLAVLPTSKAAIALYRSAGMEQAGIFHGVHGENLVFVGAAAELHVGVGELVEAAA